MSEWRFFVRSKEGMMARAYARAGAPWTAGTDDSPRYMVLARTWDGTRRVERGSFIEGPDGATAFLSEADAWAAFDRTGVGRREDYEVAPE